MEASKGLALTIALIAMVSLVGSAFGESITVDATMPQIVTIDFPASTSFGKLNAGGNPTYLDYQYIHLTTNCNWAMSAYSDNNGHLTQSSPPYDYIRGPVSISFPYDWPYISSPMSLEGHGPSNPLSITSSKRGDFMMHYQLSTQADGSEDPSYPYDVAITFVVNTW